MSLLAAPPVQGVAPTLEPYPGPRPFRVEEQQLFFGRKTESLNLRDLVLSYPVTVLYAQTGAGKSSLVNAGLCPLLKEAGLDEVRVSRVGGQLPRGLVSQQISNVFVYNAISQFLEAESKPGAAPEGVRDLKDLDLVSHLRVAWVQKPRLLIFDQFEELFTAYPECWQKRQEFFQKLNGALEGDKSRNLPPDEDLHILFVIREEHLASLDPYSELLPNGLRIRYHLERLREDQAKEAIVEPAALRSYRYTDEAIALLLSKLYSTNVQVRTDKGPATQRVIGEFAEPLHLQAACQNLWKHRPLSYRSFTEEQVKEFGDVERVLTDFYERAVARARKEAKVKE